MQGPGVLKLAVQEARTRYSGLLSLVSSGGSGSARVNPREPDRKAHMYALHGRATVVRSKGHTRFSTRIRTRNQAPFFRSCEGSCSEHSGQKVVTTCHVNLRCYALRDVLFLTRMCFPLPPYGHAL